MLCVSLRPSNGGYQSQGVSRPLARILSREVGRGLAASGVSMRSAQCYGPWPYPTEIYFATASDEKYLYVWNTHTGNSDG